MYCNNCGKKGHIYKNCKNPITSCGNIIFRDDGDEPEVLMIQRKDSLCYIDFIRGKYDHKEINYIQTLIDKCSVNEKERLLTLSFHDLWKDLWLLKEDFVKNDDFKKCLNKFNSIKEGVIFKDQKINIEYLIDNSKYKYTSSEWEFPKGRRNKNENNYECAKREFNEETNYDTSDYSIIHNVSPLNEEFTGENKVRYRYIYFIGKLTNLEKQTKLDITNYEQISEIKNIKWLSKTKTMDKCRDYHYSRMKLIGNIFDFIDMLKSEKYSLID